MPFFGAIVGFFITGILGDNMGRRLTMMVCLGAGITGYVIIILAGNLVGASVGLFVCGFGIETCFNLGLYFVSEVLENRQRQQMGVFIQGVFCVGGLFTVFIFYLFKDWRMIFIVFCLIPLVVCLAFNIFFVKETPQFLIKRYNVE
jgi:MFS family permease